MTTEGLEGLWEGIGSPEGWPSGQASPQTLQGGAAVPVKPHQAQAQRGEEVGPRRPGLRAGASALPELRLQLAWPATLTALQAFQERQAPLPLRFLPEQRASNTSLHQLRA